MSDLYTETHGTGPDLVFLHGWGLNLRVWDGLIREMANSFRIITVDLPGHGRSAWNPKASTPAAQAWQVHTALDRFRHRYSLLGWSLGARSRWIWPPRSRAVSSAWSGRRPRRDSQRARIGRLACPPRRWRRWRLNCRTNYKRTVNDFLELQVRGSVASEKVLADLQASLVRPRRGTPEGARYRPDHAGKQRPAPDVEPGARTDAGHRRPIRSGDAAGRIAGARGSIARRAVC